VVSQLGNSLGIGQGLSVAQIAEGGSVEPRQKAHPRPGVLQALQAVGERARPILGDVLFDLT
jgi:hypothetical protein